MRLVSEHSSVVPHTTVYHAYNDQSYTPLARIECTDNPLNPQRGIYYTHSSLSGLPKALTNSEGEIVWQGQYFDKDKFVGNKFEQRLRWPVGRVSG
nr:RHS domain-containing protein [Proteus mirabilis]